MTAKKKILIADDEVRITQLVSDFLNAAGLDTITTFDGDSAIEIFEKRRDISLVILDIMMPGKDGWQVCKEIRETSNVPVILLTARGEEFDQLMGFESGADDYVIKPFSPAVLVKRIEALLKRSQKSVTVNKENGLVIDKEAFVAFLDGNELKLTLKEFEILVYLSENPSRVLTRDQILNAVWGWDFEGDTRTVDSHVARLRTKLLDFGTKHLKTIYGVGYRFEW